MLCFSRVHSEAGKTNCPFLGIWLAPCRLPRSFLPSWPLALAVSFAHASPWPNSALSGVFVSSSPLRRTPSTGFRPLLSP